MPPRKPQPPMETWHCPKCFEEVDVLQNSVSVSHSCEWNKNKATAWKKGKSPEPRRSKVKK